jgi:hypothetical protein
MSRTYEAIRKQLNLDFLVATGRRAIVATIEPASDSFVQTKPTTIVQTIEPAVDLAELWCARFPLR